MIKRDRGTQLQQKLEKIHEFARENLIISSDKMKRRYENNSVPHPYQIGDLVWLYNPTRVSTWAKF